jgi:biotin/methionine sulfoxide reductase
VAFGGLRRDTTRVTPGGRATHTVARELASAKAHVVSVSPLRDDSSGAEWWPIRPGTDVALMFALAHELAGQVDLDFLRRFTVGGDRFLASVRDCTPAWASQICGVPAQAIADLARRMAAGRTFITAATRSTTIRI